MKKWISLLAAIVLMGTLAACNSTPADPTEDTTLPTQTEGTKPNVTAPSDSTEPSGDVTEPVTDPSDPSDPTEGTTAPSEPDVTEPQPTEPVHIHSYAAAVTAPTCTDEGYTVYTCDCGDSYIGDKVNPTGHSYGDWVTTVEPTTAATGMAVRKCANCAAAENRTLDKLIENHTHSYTAKTTKAPTCTAEGVMTYTCSCGGSYTESIVKLGHDYSKKEVTAPTCTSEGYTTHTCSRCSDSYKDTYTNVASHNYESKVVAATCTEQGYTSYTCSRCNDSYKNSYVNAKGHSYTSKVTTAATCTTKGVETYTCSSCKHSYTKDIAATGHSYTSKVTTSAGCVTNGVKTYTCSKCNNSYNESIAATGHNYTSKVTAPTCTAQGYTTYTCSKCSNSYKDNYTAATGHKSTYTETKPANCSQDGYKKTICSTCKKTISTTTIPASGNCSFTTTMRMDKAVRAQWEKDGVSAYADWAGYTDWDVEVCSGCGDIDIDSLRFAYTDYEAAELMLGYVNDLREEVYGTDEYNLVLDDTLMELAKIRAKELHENPTHGGTYTNARENITSGDVGIYAQYQSWYDSAGHKKTMLDTDMVYFGYALYKATDNSDCSGIYGVQLFWDEDSMDWYMSIYG